MPPDSMPKKNPPPPPLSEDDVIAWLKAHPGLFQRRPEALDHVTPPREHKGKGIADFQFYMVQRLRADRDDVLESAREVVETSRANMNIQTRVHTAVLMLMEARDFEDFIRTITMDFASVLDIDIVSLIVETEGTVIPHIDLAGVRAVSPGTVNLLMKDRDVVLEAAVNGLAELYGGGATLVKSQALIRLNIQRGGAPSLLALGSRDPGLFQEGQGTELAGFLGRVTERCFRTWLGLPPT